MSKRVLDILFDSKAKVKILKYIFRNSEENFSVSDIARHTQENRNLVKREVAKFIEMGLLKKQ